MVKKITVALIVAVVTTGLCLAAAGSVRVLADEEAAKITGGASCTEICSQAYEVPCNEMVGGHCSGFHSVYYRRICCEGCGSGCSQSPMVYKKMEECMEDTQNPGECIGDGEWFYFNMYACG
jgi:hypothetical protein